MPHRESNIKKLNTAKIMAETFGRYNIFATLSLSLSQALTYNKISTVSPLAGASIYGFSWINQGRPHCFYPATEYIKYFKDNRHHDEM